MLRRLQLLVEPRLRAAGNMGSQCYLPQVSTLHLYPSQLGWFSIYRPRRDERLNWPGWLVWLQSKVAYLSAVSYPHPSK